MLLKEKVLTYLALDRELNCGKWFRIVAIFTLTLVCGAALCVFIFDPYYRYRWPSIYKPLYYKSYATAPRLFRQFDFDMLMLGSSMAGNFFLSDIDKEFGCKSLKISADGASSYDLKKMFDTAVAAKGSKIKQVIYLLDIYAVNKPQKRYEKFDYMYRNDYSEEYRYLFDKEALKSVYYIIKRPFRLKGTRKYQAEFNRMFFSEHDKSRYSMAQVIKSARECVADGVRAASGYPGYRNIVETEILSMFDCHPDIKFTVIMPPYHLYTLCLSEYFGESESFLKQKTEILSELVKRKNVRVIDLQCDPQIVCDGSYYIDVQHYSSALGKKILKWAAEGKYLLRGKEDIVDNENKLRKMVQETMPQFRKDIGKNR